MWGGGKGGGRRSQYLYVLALPDDFFKSVGIRVDSKKKFVGQDTNVHLSNERFSFGPGFETTASQYCAEFK